MTGAETSGFRAEWISVPAADVALWTRRGWALHGYARSEASEVGQVDRAGARHPMRDVAILRRPLVLRDEGEGA